MLRSLAVTTRRRRHIVAIVAILFIAVASTFAVIVLRSIETIRNTANQIDDARAVDAATGAVEALRSQLSGTIHDNVSWDGKQLNSITRQYWIIDNWALTDSDNPLYDTAIVIDVRGKVIVAYKDGMELGQAPAAYFGTDLETPIAQAYNVKRKSAPVPVQFINTKGGVAVVGAATRGSYAFRPVREQCETVQAVRAPGMSNISPRDRPSKATNAYRSYGAKVPIVVPPRT
jgi:hypothetical protein